MARTIDTIYGTIIAEKNTKAELAELESESNTAIYKLWAYITAVCIWTLEMLFDEHKAEVDAKIAAAPVGTPAWYAARSLEFQLGDDVEIIDNVIRYPDGSTGEKIVTRATAKNTADGILLIKVAKGEAGALEPLTEPEFNQFKGYINRIQFGGIRIRSLSIDADQLRVFGNIYYDPIYNLDELKTAVETALNEFLKNIPFDGLLYRERMRDAVQAVTGVVDVEFGNIFARSEAIEFPVTRVYEMQSGYAVQDPVDTFLSTLVFVAS